MLLQCKKCAYPNLPTSDVCTRCGNVTQSPDELAKSIQLWTGLPEQVRIEFEQKYKAAQAKHAQRPQFLKKNRWNCMLLGGVSLGVVGLIHGPLIVIDFAVGAAIGLILNMTGGGSFTGTLLFGLGYLISFLLKAMMGFFWGNSITLLNGLLVAICVGYFIGLAFDLKRSNDI